MVSTRVARGATFPSCRSARSRTLGNGGAAPPVSKREPEPASSGGDVAKSSRAAGGPQGSSEFRPSRPTIRCRQPRTEEGPHRAVGPLPEKAYAGLA